MRDVLIRSGRVGPEELPLASQDLPPGGGPAAIGDFARWLGVPEGRREVFVKVVSQFLEPDGAGAEAPSDLSDAPAAAEGRRRGPHARGGTDALRPLPHRLLAHAHRVRASEGLRSGLGRAATGLRVLRAVGAGAFVLTGVDAVGTLRPCAWGVPGLLCVSINRT